MRTLNLGILAHVDAGKTSLTERLLFTAGAIDTIGSVDRGSTTTDSLVLERQRGITIKSAVVSFVLHGTRINLIDTPGHPDFIAEVERVLTVLDGAVLVLSAVEGVQAQTRLLMRTLARLRIPTLLFINKIDRTGARPDRVLEQIRQKLTPAVVSMGAVHTPGTRDAACTPYAANDAAFTTALADLLAEHDDAILTAYLDDGVPPPYGRLHGALVEQTARALVHPVFCGSAITGAGIDALTAGIAELLPAAGGDADGPVSGTVFKVERGPAGEKLAYVRMWAGTLRARDRLGFAHGDEAKVTAIDLLDGGAAGQQAAVAAGGIARLRGLSAIRIGDPIGVRRNGAEQHHFAPPTLDAVVVPRRAADRGTLRVALDQLAEQDPLINVRHDETRGEIHVSLYGEVQKEVIEATLATDYGIVVDFHETTPICIERPAGTGEAVEIIRQAPNPFLATVGLRVAPAALNSGLQVELAGEVLGTMPLAFFKAVEDTVRDTLRQGLHGWQVTDCTVTVTHSGYYPRQSHAHQGFSKSMSSTGEDFRGLTPLVVMSALARAGTSVYEPLHRFHLEIPADAFGAIVPALARLRAVPTDREMRGESYVIEGTVPAAHLHELQQSLPGLTRGEGVLESAFERYEPVQGVVPSRPRTDHNPLDRKEYLLHVLRRV